MYESASTFAYFPPYDGAIYSDFSVIPDTHYGSYLMPNFWDRGVFIPDENSAGREDNVHKIGFERPMGKPVVGGFTSVLQPQALSLSLS